MGVYSECFIVCFGQVWKGRWDNSNAKAIIYNVHKYFERENAKSKNRDPPKLTFKTAGRVTVSLQ